MMRILFIVPYAPGPVRTRPHHFIRALHGRGHDVTVLTLHENADEAAQLSALAAEGITVLSEPLTRRRALANVARAALSTEPLQAAYCRQPALERRLVELLRPIAGRAPYDTVHVEHLRGAHYGQQAIRQLGPSRRVPVVWDSVDCISHLFRQAATYSATGFGRWVTRLELPRTERLEGRLIARFDGVLTSSAADRDILAGLSGADHAIRVVPNGVDLAHFSPGPSARRDEATVVLSGKMSYHANATMAVALVRDIMPLVWASRPDVRVIVAGKEPGPAVRALAADPRVDVTGAVASMAEVLQQATIAVAPMVYGAGIQNKVLEAMACGTPVVTTAAAAAPLGVIAGRDLLLGEDAATMAAAIQALLEQPERRAAVGAAGRAYVEAHHDWDYITAHLEDTYQAAAERLRSGRSSDPTTLLAARQTAAGAPEVEGAARPVAVRRPMVGGE